jgi:FtsZ-binding cell division protein ZapB
MGVDENKIIEELSEEVKKLKKENEEQQRQVQTFQSDYWKLKDEGELWKNLPWYKRLFVK